MEKKKKEKKEEIIVLDAGIDAIEGDGPRGICCMVMFMPFFG